MVKRVVVAAADLREEPALVAALAPRADVLVAARCVDASLLLDQVHAVDANTIVLSDGLPNLCPSIVREAHERGVDVIGVGDATWPEVSWVDISSGYDDLIERVMGEPVAPGSGVWQVPRVEAARAQLISVWGPTGAPGRTTIATALAAELAETMRVLLVDADPFGGAIAVNLGVTEDASGIAIACTQALRGSLSADAMRRIPRAVTDRLAIVSGIHQARRWPELCVIDQVWEACRDLADVVVADVGFCIEDRDDVGRRSASTLATLAVSDVVIAVGSADPVGMLRLVNELEQLVSLAPAARIVVVMNKVRKGSMSESAVRDACAAAGIEHPIVCVAFDDASCSAAITTGSVISPRSPVRTSLRQVSAALACASSSSI